MSKFNALRKCTDRIDRLDYWRQDLPKCPHCGDECSVVDNEWWHLYEEGEHEVTCPSCENNFQVSTHVSFSFSTDEQDIDDEATGGQQ